MPLNSDVSASEVAELRAELAELRRINLRRSDREQLSGVVNLTMTLALIAVEALARSSTPMAGVLALEIFEELTLREIENAAGAPVRRRREAPIEIVLAPYSELQPFEDQTWR